MKIYLADGEPLDIIGMGDDNLKMPNGLVWKIQKVRCIRPDEEFDFSWTTRR